MRQFDGLSINEICLANFPLAHGCSLQFSVCAAGARSSGRNDLEIPASTRRRTRNLDSTLNRIARDQATAMASKDVLDHDVLGPFSSRVTSLKSLRAAENIAYGHASFSKTLDQWINSPGHQRNLLLHGASKVGVASAKSARTGRTYWAMLIAGAHERSSSPSAKPTKSRHSERACRIKILGLCL